MRRCLRELQFAHLEVASDVVSTSNEFIHQLHSKPYDVILAEYSRPDWKGVSATDLLLQTQSLEHVPLIFLTKRIRRETVAELITRGASDCIEMDHIGHLPVAIRQALNENHLRGERDRAERMLRHSEAQFRALVGNLTYGICCCTMDGMFIDVNPSLAAMLGYASREELLEVNRSVATICEPLRLAQLLCNYCEASPSDPVEMDWTRKDGGILKIRLTARRIGTEEDVLKSYEVIAEDITKQRALEDHLRRQAAKDPLTGLANYRHLVEVLDAEIKRTQRTDRQFGLLLFDLDGLKKINDVHGHVVGSQALCRVADALVMGSREIDTPARFGGDEFALVLPETMLDASKHVARRICESIANDEREPRISVSVGVAIYPTDGERIDSLLSSADAAMYLMKNAHHASPIPPKP
ncbi:MAG TPA: diguanylate cyclase [Candidatus Acidoferrales bacterium]|jgi:diguanylate cyclase (GGDEF)-like protein/PAS domain S-box-containing protein|nr:diguanylate cyclase [Candidatus Acidoferrales bacterium]